MTVKCPYCGFIMPWEPQPTAALVRCPNREQTAWLNTNRTIPQTATVIYCTTDFKDVHIESYQIDEPDRAPRWYCKRTFIVRA